MVIKYLPGWLPVSQDFQNKSATSPLCNAGPLFLMERAAEYNRQLCKIYGRALGRLFFCQLVLLIRTFTSVALVHNWLGFRS